MGVGRVVGVERDFARSLSASVRLCEDAAPFEAFIAAFCALDRAEIGHEVDGDCDWDAFFSLAESMLLSEAGSASERASGLCCRETEEAMTFGAGLAR